MLKQQTARLLNRLFHSPLTLALIALFADASLACADECLKSIKNNIADYPVFSLIPVDNPAFANISDINQRLDNIRQNNIEAALEYWSGDEFHEVTADITTTQERFSQSILGMTAKGNFFVQKTYGKQLEGNNRIAITQRFKIDAACKEKLVQTEMLDLAFTTKTITKKLFVDDRLEVATIAIEELPEISDFLSFENFRKTTGPAKTSAYLAPSMPYIKVRIEESSSQTPLYDPLLKKEMPTTKKHLRYELDGLGELIVDLYTSSHSPYEKIHINGLFFQNVILERLNKSLWLSSELVAEVDNVQYMTSLIETDSGDLKPFKILSNLPLDHVNLANYPHIQFIGDNNGQYAYQILADYGHTPVKTQDDGVAQYLRPSFYINSDAAKVREIAALAGSKDTESTLNLILYIANKIVKYDRSQEENHTFRLLTTEQIIDYKAGLCQNFANVVVALARARDIPARMIYGWLLAPKGAIHHSWVEVYVDKAWVPLEPQSQSLKRATLTNHYIPICIYTDYEASGSTNDIKMTLKIEGYRLLVE